MSTNGCMGQLLGPFEANEELYDKIKKQSIKEMLYIKHLGIQIDECTDEKQKDKQFFVFINGEEIEIGKYGVYEVGNTEITSIYFPTDMNDNTIIDYVIETSK